MPKRLHIEHGSEWYEVDQRGRIRRHNWKASDQWRFLGFSFHHWRNGIDITLDEIFADPERIKGKVLWGWDMDHGTLRRWGSPRTHRAYVSV